MLKSKLNLSGTLTLIVQHKNGTESRYKFKNIITTIGLISIAKLFSGDLTGQPFNHIALGDGGTTENPTDTSLENELVRKSAIVENLPSPDETIVRFQSVWLIGEATGTYREAGILDAATAGNLFNRATYSDITVSATDALIARWEIDFQNV